MPRSTTVLDYSPKASAVKASFYFCISLAYLLLVPNAYADLNSPPLRTQTISLDFSTQSSLYFSFDQGPGEFTRITLPTNGWMLVMRSESKQSNEQLISTPRTPLLETQLLLNDSDCLQCEIELTTEQPIPSPIEFSLTLETFSKTEHSSRFEFENAYFDLFKNGQYLGRLSQLALLRKLLTESSNPADKARTCGLINISFDEDADEQENMLSCISYFKDQNRMDLARLFTIDYASRIWFLGLTAEAESLFHNLIKELSEDNPALSQSKRIYLLADAKRRFAIIQIQLGNYQEARRLLSEAVAGLEQIGDKQMSAAALLDWGNSYRFDNQMALAVEKLTLAAKVNESSILPGLQVRIRTEYNTAIVHALQGQYFFALRLINSAEHQARHHGGTLWLGHILAAKARILMELGRLKESEAVYAEAWQLYVSDGSTSHLATVSNNLANLYSQKGDFEQARHYLQLASEYTGNEWGQEQHLKIQQARINYQLKNGNLSAALAELADLETKLADSDDEFRLGRFFSQKGEALILAGREQEALAALKQAINHHKQSLDNLYLTRSHYLSAEASFALKYPLALIDDHLDQAIATIETIRNDLQDDRLRQEYFALQKSIYELAIEAQLASNQPQQPSDEKKIGASLFRAESFRARTLLESLLTTKYTTVSDKSNKILDKDGWTW